MTGENAGLYRPGVIMWLMVFFIAHSTHSAPVYDEDTTQVAEYEGAAPGCYYNFQYYEEGDRIMTNEPCLNCTCHNRMLMCYLRVCPQFTKAIGQNCQVEKRPDQCCPVITCPEVPVHLLTSTTSAPSSSSDTTEVGFHDNYGCSIDNKFYADGAQLPTDPNNPCELCYCIRNRTTCTMQQCTLKIARCNPVFHPGICCPVKYDCDYDEELTTIPGTTPGLIMTTTMAPGIESPKCTYQGKLFNDGDLLYSTQPCHHCYCFNGGITCAVQECGKPMETHGKNCTAVTPPEGECCPTTYKCEDESGSIDGEEQQQVTLDENEIVATQATLSTEKVNEEEQKHESIFPGADNVIPEVHQIQDEATPDTTGIKTTTQTASIESHLSTSTIKLETDEMVMTGATPVQIPDDNAVPQKPVEAVSSTDITTQHIEESRPTKPTIPVEHVEPEKSTTIAEDMEAAKSSEDEPEGEKPTVVTEIQIETSEKPSTSLPARSEDQLPIEPQTIQPGEMSTHLPRSENESTETPTTAEPVTSKTNENQEKEEAPVPTIPESNEIPEGSKITGEVTAKPEDTIIISGVSEPEEIKHEEAPTEPSISEMPKISEESKPVTEFPKTELSKGSEEASTVQPNKIPDISNRIPEQEPLSVTTEEKKPGDATRTSPSSVHTNLTYEEPTTEAIEPEINEVPTQGPPGIIVPTRGPVTKAEDNESIPEVQVTEDYEETPGIVEIHTPENLITDKPEVPVEVSSGTTVVGEEKIMENPQTPKEELAVLVTETSETKPEEQTSEEHNQYLRPTQATEAPSVNVEQSTVSAQSEETSTTLSTGINGVDMPTKGIQVSGEQSSEEATSSEAPTTGEKQPNSSENSSEEESEESSSSFTPSENPLSTKLPSKTENENTTEGQVTVIPEEKETIVPIEHEILTEKGPTETLTEATLTNVSPVKESSTESSKEMQTQKKKVTSGQPIEQQATNKPIESKPTEEVYTSEGLTEMSPIGQPEAENPLENSSEQLEGEHSLDDEQTEVKLIERPTTQQPAVGQPIEEETTKVQSTEKSEKEQSAKEELSKKPTEMLPVEEHAAEEKPTEKPTREEPTELKPTAESPTEMETTKVQLTTETLTGKPQEEGKPIESPAEEPAMESKPTEGNAAEVGLTEVQVTTELPTEEKLSENSTDQSRTEISTDKSEEVLPEEEKTTEKSTEEQPSATIPTKIPPTREKTTEEKPIEEKPIESQTEQEGTENFGEVQITEAHQPATEESTELPHEKLVTVGIEVETSTSNSTEHSPISLPAGTEQTEGTKITEEITEPSVSSVPQELSTEVIGFGPTSEEGESTTTKLPFITEDVSEENATEQPTTEVKLEMKPEQSIKPSEELIPVLEHTESSISVQPSTEIKTSKDSEKQQTGQSITPEEMESTKEPNVETNLTNQTPSMPTKPPKLEFEKEGQAMSSDEIEFQTTEAVTQSTITGEISIQKETESDDEILQTSTPSIISKETSGTTMKEEDLIEYPASTHSAVPEKELNKKSESHSTEIHTPEKKPSEATMTEVTFPESNELPGQTQPESKPEKQSTEKVTEVTSLSSEQKIPMKPGISEEEHSSIPTEDSITTITSTEKVLKAEVTYTSVPGQQPNEEPVRTTEISSEIHTTMSGNLAVSHAEENPVESTEQHTIASIPEQEQTLGMSAESVTVPTFLTENKEVTEEHEIPTLQNKSSTEPATASEESPINSEQPHEISETSSSTEHAIANEETTVNIKQITKKPEGAHEEKPAKEELPSAVTASSTSVIEEETTASIPAETETLIEGEPIVTDAPVLQPSESMTKAPTEEENSKVTSPVFLPSTEQQPESPTESSNQTVESTEKSVEVKPSLTKESEEPSPTTSKESELPSIPGEGNCLIDGESFTNNSEIPPANPCQISCHCVSSIVQCELVQCPPPLDHLSNCMPIHMSSDTCCPMYSCDASPTATLEADNQMAGHPVPEEQDQEQETERPEISRVPVEESEASEEPTKQSEEHTTALIITEESTPIISTETTTTLKLNFSVAVEHLSNVTSEITTETNKHIETPEIATKKVSTDEISPTSSSVDGIETTKASEQFENQTAPSIINQVSESDNVTSVPEKEISTEAELITISQVPDNEIGVSMTETPGQHSVAPEQAQTENEMISTEGIKEPTTTIDIHEIMSNVGGTPEVEPSSEPSIIPTTGEPKPIDSEKTTSIVVESPITEKEPVEKSSDKSYEQTIPLEHSNEVTQTSPIEKLPTKPVVVKQTGTPPPEPETTKLESGATSIITEHTTAPIIHEVETMTLIHEEAGSKTTEGTLSISNTEIPSVTEEYTQVYKESSEILQTQMTPQKTDITPENDSITAIPEAHKTTGEQSTVAITPEGSTQPSISSEQPDKMTETPELLKVPTKPVITIETSTPDEYTLLTESPSQPSTELSSSSIIPEMSEYPIGIVTNEVEIAKPVATESSNIPSSESETPTSTTHDFEAEPEISVTEMPVIETSKEQEEHQIASSTPTTIQTEQVSGEAAQTTIATATETEPTESQSHKNETEKPFEVTSAASVETDLPTKPSSAQGSEEGAEGIKSATKPSDLETSVTEIITTEKASEIPHIIEESTESLPPSNEKTISENVNVPVITEKPKGESIPHIDGESSSPISPDSTPTSEIPSEEQSLSSEAPAEAFTTTYEEDSTEFTEDITKTPAIPSIEIPVIIPLDETKSTEVPVEDDKKVETEIKTDETLKPITEEVTTELLHEWKPVETSSPPNRTSSTILPVTPELSTQSEDVSPTTIADTDEKSTGTTEQQPIKPEETSISQSQATETTTLPALGGSTHQAPMESFSESSQASAIPVDSEETLITESKPIEEVNQATSEIYPIESVDKTTSTTPPSEPTNDIQDNQVPELPMTFEDHTDTEGQQTISPIEPEIVQEHVTESDKNISSPHHTYVPPSSTELPTGGEYPEQSVSSEDNPHFPIHGGTQMNSDEDYEEDDQAVYGPGTCRYGGKVYVSAQQIPRDDPCDFCFCFRSDIICLQQSCPPPIPGCHEEPIGGFCCPRYECPVSMATSVNVTTTTTTTTTTLPPHFLSHAYKGATRRSGCLIGGRTYGVGDVIQSASGPCLHCICGGDGNMKCDPRVCSPEPMIRQMIAAATAKRRR